MRDENQTLWKNTVAAFKRQFTQLDKLIAEAKQTAKDLADPSKKTDGKAAKKLVEPLQRKLGLVNNYVNNLHSILPLAAVTEDDGIHSVWRGYPLFLTNVLIEQKEETKSSLLFWKPLKNGSFIKRRIQKIQREV